MTDVSDAPFALVVDNDGIIRMSACDILSNAGFRPLESANVEEALGVLDSTPAVALLFTDVQMPGGRDSFELTREMADRWPDVKIRRDLGCYRHTRAAGSVALTDGGGGIIVNFVLVMRLWRATVAGEGAKSPLFSRAPYRWSIALALVAIAAALALLLNLGLESALVPAIGVIVGLQLTEFWLATRSARFLAICAGMCGCLELAWPWIGHAPAAPAKAGTRSAAAPVNSDRRSISLRARATAPHFGPSTRQRCRKPRQTSCAIRQDRQERRPRLPPRARALYPAGSPRDCGSSAGPPRPPPRLCRPAAPL